MGYIVRDPELFAAVYFNPPFPPPPFLRPLWYIKS
jgi:hypothetical protein